MPVRGTQWRCLVRVSSVMRYDCSVSSVMGSDCIVDVSESASKGTQWRCLVLRPSPKIRRAIRPMIDEAWRTLTTGRMM